jgi:hypothetical protein
MTKTIEIDFLSLSHMLNLTIYFFTIQNKIIPKIQPKCSNYKIDQGVKTPLTRIMATI